MQNTANDVNMHAHYAADYNYQLVLPLPPPMLKEIYPGDLILVAFFSRWCIDHIPLHRTLILSRQPPDLACA